MAGKPPLGVHGIYPVGQRTSGSRFDSLSWGTHMCGFYHTKQDLLDGVVPFLQSGLRGDELCVWVTSTPLEQEEAAGALDQRQSDSGDSLPWDQVHIRPYDDWYLEGDQFSAERAIANATDAYGHALDQGYQGLRLTGNLSWLDSGAWESFCSYEAEVDGLIRNGRMKVLCTYRLDALGRTEVRNVVATHMRALRRSCDWSLAATDEKERAADEIAGENNLRNALLGLPILGRMAELEHICSAAQASLSDMEPWQWIPAEVDASKAIAEMIGAFDALPSARLSMESLAQDLGEIHCMITEAGSARASADHKEMVFEVVGCPKLELCRGLPKDSGCCGPGTEHWPPSGLCLADLVVGGVLQAAAQTPVGICTTFHDDGCRKSIMPAWHADVISGLGGIGVESLLIMYQDRILLSHLSSASHAHALSQALMEREDRRGGPPAKGSLGFGSETVAYARNGDLWISACLRHGAPLQAAIERLAKVIRQARLWA